MGEARLIGQSMRPLARQGCSSTTGSLGSEISELVGLVGWLCWAVATVAMRRNLPSRIRMAQIRKGYHTILRQRTVPNSPGPAWETQSPLIQLRLRGQAALATRARVLCHGLRPMPDKSDYRNVALGSHSGTRPTVRRTGKLTCEALGKKSGARPSYATALDALFAEDCPKVPSVI
jgi:hypothetical protein